MKFMTNSLWHASALPMSPLAGAYATLSPSLTGELSLKPMGWGALTGDQHHRSSERG